MGQMCCTSIPLPAKAFLVILHRVTLSPRAHFLEFTSIRSLLYQAVVLLPLEEELVLLLERKAVVLSLHITPILSPRGVRSITFPTADQFYKLGQHYSQLLRSAEESATQAYTCDKPTRIAPRLCSKYQPPTRPNPSDIQILGGYPCINNCTSFAPWRG